MLQNGAYFGRRGSPPTAKAAKRKSTVAGLLCAACPPCPSSVVQLPVSE